MLASPSDRLSRLFLVVRISATASHLRPVMGSAKAGMERSSLVNSISNFVAVKAQEDGKVEEIGRGHLPNAVLRLSIGDRPVCSSPLSRSLMRERICVAKT